MRPPRVAFQRRRSLAMNLLPTNSAESTANMLRRESPAILRRRTFFLAAVLLSGLFLFWNSESIRLFPSFPLYPYMFPSVFEGSSPVGKENRLEKVLNDASMKDGTVILTTVNEAWAAPNSVLDLFLESFRIGEGTYRLLNHLVIIALDQKAFRYCLDVHKHCFSLISEEDDFHQEAYFMTPDYLKMMWKRIDFLRSILELGYNFVFTDADIMWFRDPFPRFFPDADFQIACDHFLGNSSDVQNRPNGGFNYVKSNNRSIEFYKFWYESRETYPGYHDQDVLNFIKFDHFILDIGLKMRFLDTAYFGGFCEPSKDLNQVCTMHANCCVGLNSKLHDLRIMLQDWKHFIYLPETWRWSSFISWSVPQNCSLDAVLQSGSPQKVEFVLEN